MASPCSIRLATESDVCIIHEIHLKCIREICSSHYTESDVRKWTGRQSDNRYLSIMKVGTMFVAEIMATQNEREKEIVGFGHVGPTDKEGCSHEVRALYVEPKSNGKGVGTTLLTALQDVALREGCNKLLVFSSKNAVKFYEKFGFVRGECVKQYPGECDSLMCVQMIKSLNVQ